MFVEINDTSSSNLPVNPMEIFHVSPQPPITRPSGFYVHQFIWVTEGEGCFEAGGKNTILSKGQGMFTRKTAPHSYTPSDGNFATSWVTFLGGEAILDYYAVGEYMFFDVPDFLNDSAEKLEKLCQSSSLAMRSAHMCRWMTELLDSIFSSKINFENKVNDYLERNFAKPLSLDTVAANFGMDKYKLCHLYNSEANTTVMSTLKRIRIEKAKKMLENTIIPIEQAASMCGFDSPSYFIKIFKSETGLTPNEYRKTLKNI